MRCDKFHSTYISPSSLFDIVRVRMMLDLNNNLAKDEEFTNEIETLHDNLEKIQRIQGKIKSNKSFFSFLSFRATFLFFHSRFEFVHVRGGEKLEEN